MTDNFAGHDFVEIIDATIASSATKKSVDVRSAIQELSLFSSIFNPTMSGAVVLLDTSDLVYTLPIVGEEVLRLQIQTPDREPLERYFYIHSVGGVTPHAAGAKRQLVLQFSSSSQTAAVSTPITRAFKDTISEMVRGIMDSDVKTDMPIEIEDTQGVETLVIPHMNCWAAIDMMRQRAVSARYKSPYLFFEDTTGFNFCSVEYLLEKRRDAAEDLSYTAESFLPEAGEVGDQVTILGRQYRTVDQLSVERKADMLELVNGGGIQNRTTVFDLLDKSIKDTDVDYKKFTGEVQQAFGDKFNPNHSVPQQASGTPVVTYMVPIDSTNPSAAADNVGMRRMFGRHLRETKIGFTAYGDSELKAGDIITFMMPGRSESPEEEDRQLSGLYLVANIAWHIKSASMMTRVEAYRIGFDEDLFGGSQ